MKTQDSKYCSACKQVKLHSMFSRNKASRDGYQTQCRACVNEKQKYRYHTEPEFRKRLIASVSKKQVEKYRTDAVYRQSKKDYQKTHAALKAQLTKCAEE